MKYWLFLLVLLLSSTSHAATINVINPGFEEDVLADDQFTTSGAVGWTATVSGTGGGGAFNPDPGSLPGGIAPEGSNIGWVNGGTLTQVLDDVLLAQSTYTLSVLVVNRLEPGAFPGYGIRLLAGDTVIAEDNNSLSPEDGEWLQSTLTYTAGFDDELIGQALAIQFTSAGIQSNFDSVSLEVSTVPLPGGLALLAGGLLSLLAARNSGSLTDRKLRTP